MQWIMKKDNALWESSLKNGASLLICHTCSNEYNVFHKTCRGIRWISRGCKTLIRAFQKAESWTVERGIK